mmetsp:Transcript_8589/g.13554  ORF Transcript_8589/g.13554 Transcript_8589/m.13554 type:complete len:188 (-) Transcript_8589:196-759(-)
MSFFEESGDFDGALREKNAPKVPPRRRRAPVNDEDEQPEPQQPAPDAGPQAKKTGGWGTDDGGVQQPVAGRRAATTTETTGLKPVEVDSTTKEDDDIMVIPDLEENEEDNITMTVADAGAVAAPTLPTNLGLDDASLPPAQSDGIDLSMLYECLLPHKQLMMDDGSWCASQFLPFVLCWEGVPHRTY